jgi:hypothetical protein
MQKLAASLHAKVDEQIERTVHLIGLVPADRVQWRAPVAGAWTVDGILGHLLDCLAGICAVLVAAEPERLTHFTALRDMKTNHQCAPGEAIASANIFREHIAEGMALLGDGDLARLIPTVFVPQGETLLTLLLGNFEHLLNHKHQLFMYLKLMGVDVSSRDLYRFRGE